MPAPTTSSRRAISRDIVRERRGSGQATHARHSSPSSGLHSVCRPRLPSRSAHSRCFATTDTAARRARAGTSSSGNVLRMFASIS
jgi:hypothetical protein